MSWCKLNIVSQQAKHLVYSKGLLLRANWHHYHYQDPMQHGITILL
jgi:hypothetical protein